MKLKLRLKPAQKRPVEGWAVETSPGSFLDRKTAPALARGREALRDEQRKLEDEERQGFVLKEQDTPFELLSRAQLINRAYRAGATKEDVFAISVQGARDLVKKLEGWKEDADVDKLENSLGIKLTPLQRLIAKKIANQKQPSKLEFVVGKPKLKLGLR
jgi:hypothetical protein